MKINSNQKKFNNNSEWNTKNSLIEKSNPPLVQNRY